MYRMKPIANAGSNWRHSVASGNTSTSLPHQLNYNFVIYLTTEYKTVHMMTSMVLDLDGVHVSELFL